LLVFLAFFLWIWGIVFVFSGILLSIRFSIVAVPFFLSYYFKVFLVFLWFLVFVVFFSILWYYSWY